MKSILIHPLRLLSILTGILLLFPDPTSAIPAFARKYKTSCATCHAGFPKLTPYGEAYRLNGFRMPEDEEGSVQEEPVRLGSEGYKRVWPGAIWPGSIPGTAPVSFRIRSGLKYLNDESGQYTQFTQPTLQIMTGGSFTENISFFAGAHLFDKGVSGSIDRLYLRLNHVLAGRLPYNLLFLRIGQFVPDIATYITNHRSLTHTAYAFNTYAPGGMAFEAGHVHGASAFGIEAFQLGVEAGGFLHPRLRYIVGLVNGNGADEDNNAAKDFYGKVAVKLGGMAFDGSSSGDLYGGTANNWAEKSITISAFGYFGKGGGSSGNGDEHTTLRTTTAFSGDHDSEGPANEIPFHRVGLDANLFLRDLNLFGGFITGKDDESGYALFFSEANYMFYPWLIGVFRYESAIPEGMDTLQRLVIHVTALYTANVKFNMESRIDPDEPGLTNFIIGMDFAF